jgi:BolA protein
MNILKYVNQQSIARKMTTNQTIDGVMYNRISNKLLTIAPHHFELVNESYKHNVPRGSETHFKVFVVSDKFDNLSMLEQHRLINTLLKDELQAGVHALAIKTMTLQKFQNQGGAVEFQTPNCLGGEKKGDSSRM